MRLPAALLARTDELLDLAEVGCTRLTGLQVAALSLPLPERSRLLDGTPAVRA